MRESNTNIYSGFTIKQNLPYFLKKIADIDYVELKDLSPTKELRVDYHKDKENNWLSPDEVFTQDGKTYYKR